MDASEKDHGFKPIVGEHPRVLILGTMPSQKSLAQSQYYGHPQNRFWWIMSELFGFELSLDYAARVELVSSKGIAIWDVIASCHRPGSLDASIDESSLTPNPIPSLLSQFPSISLIAFNGQAAGKLFAKHICAELNVPTLVLPSTSPAHASMKPEQKLMAWRAILDRL